MGRARPASLLSVRSDDDARSEWKGARTTSERCKHMRRLRPDLTLERQERILVYAWRGRGHRRVVKRREEAGGGAVIRSGAAAGGKQAYECRKSSSWASSVFCVGFPMIAFLCRLSVGRSIVARIRESKRESREA